jgi:oligopeptide transport system substrate-binding protein
MLFSRRIATVLVVIALTIVIPACISGCGAAGDGELTLVDSEPITLDPALSGDAGSASYIVEIFSGLVTLNHNLEVVPDIAKDWDVSSDGKTYTFHLRQGASFHSGKEVMASDFKYSLERAADPATGSPGAETYLGDIVGVKQKLRSEAEEISGLRVIDDRTLEITIDAPKAYFLAKLTHPTAFVVDEDNVEQGADWTKHPNGTGPFRLAEWTEKRSIVLERNERFYGGVANLERVTFLLTGSPMMMYENGQIDITGVSLADIDRVLDPANPLNDELVIAPRLSTAYIGFNTSMPPFDDEKVRQAFSHAVDKDKITGVLLKGLVSPADGILPLGMPGYDEELKGLGYDVERAQRLIAESSYHDVSNLPPIVFTVAGSGGGVSSISMAVAWMWQQNLGVELEIEVVEWQIFLQELREQRFQVFEIAWVADYPDPQNFLDVLFHSGSAENHTVYSNSRVDQLLEEARSESDLDARVAIYQQVEQTIVKDAPWLPLFFGREFLLVKPHVKGFFVAPMVIPYLKDIWRER